MKNVSRFLPLILVILLAVVFGTVAASLGSGRPLSNIVASSASAGSIYTVLPAQAGPGEELAAFVIRLGLKDQDPTKWDGSISVSKGSVERIGGWEVSPNTQFQGNSFVIRTRRQTPIGGAAAQGRTFPVGILVVVKTLPDATVSVTTAQGNFSFQVSEVTYTSAKTFLDGGADAIRVPAPTLLTTSDTENDFPAAAVAPDGTVWVAYIAYTLTLKEGGVPGRLTEKPKDLELYATPPGGDQLFVMSQRNGKWSEPTALTGTGQDLYRTAMAVDGQGVPWVFWSQNNAGNWDLMGRRFEGGQWSGPVRITNDPGPDIHPAAATDSSGRIWLVWQAFRGDSFDVVMAPIQGGQAGQVVTVASEPGNQWDPAIAADPAGAIYVAWDTYQKGDYDVYLRKFTNGQGEKPVPIAATQDFEVRPSLACDAQARVWIAWEQCQGRWGKDWGALDRENIALYQQRELGMACYVNGRLYKPKAAMLGNVKGQMQQLNNMARIAVDGDGRVWVAFRHRTPSRMNVGTVWRGYVTGFDGQSWTPPIELANADGAIENRPPLVRLPSGDVMVVYNSDGRAHGIPVARPVSSSKNDIWCATLPRLGKAVNPQLDEVAIEVAQPLASTEPQDVARLRDYRITVGGKTLRPVRGEFHRHTEISGDGGGDGPLIDMFRYAIDAAAFDWIGCGDHDNGSGREYTWWYTQKLTDVFVCGTKFVPMFSYERSVRYPDGHRNPIFAKRGVRTLSRLADPTGQKPNGVSDEDTPMLYEYLKRFDGICASHTSATDMGTDWRHNDPVAEPVVEIYQGCRQSYEYAGAPKSGDQKNSLGGYQPAGFVWNALEKGYILGFQSSSDHVSTHISYAIVYVPEFTRQALIDAFRARHCYGATDNILLDVRMGDQFMGDVFKSKSPAKLEVNIVGTGPLARIDVACNNRIVYSREVTDKATSLRFTWTENEVPKQPVSYYYVRVIQENEEMAWGSPMWIDRG